MVDQAGRSELCKFFYSDPKYLLIVIYATTNLYMVVRFKETVKR